MKVARRLADLNAYGITHARIDERGIHFESELAVQLADGTVTTLRMPTGLDERLAIQRLLCGGDRC
ncbi:hypothetical protein DN824_02980 [Stutzerimonas nosocomialis]|uniref:Uncharacterized protein n=1 Tax=Stutzerimonas nosocomialis TaxID=1056496 RepID=A0A5R9QG80_9GAMM|nr:type III secretion system co-regulatory protein PtrC [Stutzerimonas nosocomialis]TLX54136.1 hypothetical protein DN826_15495 [Stutzerimonas nosocomialis]TLX60910.1 hypothetical protein DN824_02980 [Stutzerimonas nosocomialis]TLX64196.1 hypothetical protein DN820_07720 [Stutzerimonas nosocomialis]